MEYVVIIGLTIIIIFQDIQHKAERKELYNRIMAKDLREFSDVEEGKPKRKGIVNLITNRKNKNGGFNKYENANLQHK